MKYESPSARQTNHLLSLIDINKPWENVAWKFVIKSTQNTNHYLISAGITALGGLGSVTVPVKITWIAGKFETLHRERLRWTSLMSSALSRIKLVSLEPLLASGDDCRDLSRYGRDWEPCGHNWTRNNIPPRTRNM